MPYMCVVIKHLFSTNHLFMAGFVLNSYHVRYSCTGKFRVTEPSINSVNNYTVRLYRVVFILTNSENVNI